MITVNITSPGGLFTPAAPANTQELTTTFSITTGTSSLTCNGAAPFVPGDTGKFFMIDGPGPHSPSETWLFGTMTYVSSTQVTLSVPATRTLTSQSALMFWGNDDGAAFAAFYTWAAAQSDNITLTLGTGSKIFMCSLVDGSNKAGCPVYGLHGITIKGNGPSSTKLVQTPIYGSFSLGATFWMKGGSNAWPTGGTEDYAARLNRVTAGATTLQCKTIADAALFVPPTWALLSGHDLMGSGQPPNPFLYEYVNIIAVNTTTGALTLAEGLDHAYSDTWPHFTDANIGLEPDHGGPATLYTLDPNWDLEATYEGFTLVNPWGQSHSKGRKFTFRNLKDVGPYGLIPTACDEVTFYDCDLTAYQMEIDKCAGHVIFDNTDTGQLVFQSSINTVVIRNGSNVNSLNGTPRDLQFIDSTVGSVGLGCTAFGRTDRFVTTGSTIPSLYYGGVNDHGEVTSAGIGVEYTMSSSGVVRMPRAGRPYPGLRWAVPGTRCRLSGSEGAPLFRGIGYGPMFTVLSVTADANYIYVQTDWPYTTGWPTWAGSINVVSSLYTSIGADTVSSDRYLTQLKAATALGYTKIGTYVTASLNGGNCGTMNGSQSITILPPVWGKVVSITIDVTTAYTGAQAGLSWFSGYGDGRGFALVDGEIAEWNPKIDLKTVGRRVITPSGVSYSSGSGGLDSGLALPSPDAWITDYWNGMGTGETNIYPEYALNPAVGPVFTFEVILDQGGSSFSENEEIGQLWLMGQDINFKRGRAATAVNGTLVLSGQPATLKRSYVMPVAYGWLDMKEPAVNLIWSATGSKTIPAGLGFPRIDGQPVTLRYARKSIITQSTLTLSGWAVALRTVRTTTAAMSALTLSGQAVTLKRNRVMPAGTGTLTLSGQTATLKRSRVMPVSFGTLTLSGQTATLKRSYVLPVTYGWLDMKEPSVNLIYSGAGNKLIPAGLGFPRIDGQPVILRYARRMPVVNGTLVLGGQAAAVGRGRMMPVLQGNIVINGQVVTLVKGFGSIMPALFVDPDVFYPPALIYPVVITPALFVDPDTFPLATATTFYGDTEIITVPLEDRRMGVTPEYRLMMTMAEDHSMEVLREDTMMDASPRKRVL